MNRPDLSVIIPSRNERFLSNTVEDILRNATSSIEVIAVLDGYWSDPPLEDDKRLHVIHFGKPRGMRAAVNAGAGVAKGQYLMKCDAHCAFGEGFDEILKADCPENSIVVPRRFSLDAVGWKPQKEPVDCERLFWPWEHPDDLGLHAVVWKERGRARRDVLIDEDMNFQGSCWMMTKEHFFKRIGGLDDARWGPFWGEPQEIGFKTWLGPWKGSILRNKKTYYSHLFKGRAYGRGYVQSPREKVNAEFFSYWWNNCWEGRARDLDWLIDHFWPIDTWPADWRNYHAN